MGCKQSKASLPPMPQSTRGAYAPRNSSESTLHAARIVSLTSSNSVRPSQNTHSYDGYYRPPEPTPAPLPIHNNNQPDRGSIRLQNAQQRLCDPAARKPLPIKNLPLGLSTGRRRAGQSMDNRDPSLFVPR